MSSPLRTLAIVPAALLFLAGAALIVMGGSNDNLALGITVIAGASLLFIAYRNWRLGLLTFLVWVLFEDLVRKYLGNNMVVYFGKDVLAAVCCLSFYIARYRERLPKVKPAFAFPLVLMVAWAFIQVFNPNSPSVWYGLLGMKLYFGYIPLFFLGYAFLRDEKDLQQLLLCCLIVAGIIASLGVAQAATGTLFLSPQNLGSDISLGATLTRVDPTTNTAFYRPPSVFVSNGRFSQYLFLAWALGLATTLHYYTRKLKGKGLVLSLLGLISVALLLSGSRGPIVLAIVTGLCMAAVRGRKIALKLVAVAVVFIFAFVAASYFFPGALESRLGYYQNSVFSTQTQKSDIAFRVFDYPAQEFAAALSNPNWLLGNGTGVCSLGTQYITRILGVPPSRIGVESGYANIMLEMGLPGLALWIVWVIYLFKSEFQILKELKKDPLFDFAIIISIFSFILLVVLVITGTTAYQDFVENAYLWFMLGVLFALPSIVLSRGQQNLQQQSAMQPAMLMGTLRRAPAHRW